MTEELEKKYEILCESFELILCPYCGHRLNRISVLLPTSCRGCGRQDFIPRILEVCEVKKRDE